MSCKYNIRQLIVLQLDENYRQNCKVSNARQYIRFLATFGLSFCKCLKLKYIYLAIVADLGSLMRVQYPKLRNMAHINSLWTFKVKLLYFIPNGKICKSANGGIESRDFSRVGRFIACVRDSPMVPLVCNPEHTRILSALFAAIYY